MLPLANETASTTHDMGVLDRWAGSYLQQQHAYQMYGTSVFRKLNTRIDHSAQLHKATKCQMD